jgi:hypothetical protein
MASHLYAPDAAAGSDDPDQREKRLSNFLLESVHTRMVFVDDLWPGF